MLMSAGCVNTSTIKTTGGLHMLRSSSWLVLMPPGGPRNRSLKCFSWSAELHRQIVSTVFSQCPVVFDVGFERFADMNNAKITSDPSTEKRESARLTSESETVLLGNFFYDLLITEESTSLTTVSWFHTSNVKYLQYLQAYLSLQG